MIGAWLAIALLTLNSLFLAVAVDRRRNEIKHLNFVLGDACADLAVLKEKQGMRDGEVVRQLTENLDEELEKSANMTEMRRAKRRTLPRENAGPPAKLSKLKFYR